MEMAEINKLTGAIIEAAMKVHSALGPGLLESAYEACLLYELRKRGYKTASQLPVPIIYDNERIEVGFRMDILVEETVIVEIKAVEKTLPIHEAQLLSHLKLSGKRVGLLMNFHVVHLRDGIKRMING